MSASSKPIFLVVTSRDCGACANFIANGQLNIIEDYVERNLAGRVRYARIMKDKMNVNEDRILTMKVFDYQTGDEEIYYANLELNMYIGWFPNFVLLPASMQPLIIAQWNDDDTLVMNDSIEWPKLSLDSMKIFAADEKGQLLGAGNRPPMNGDSVNEWLNNVLISNNKERTRSKRLTQVSKESVRKKFVVKSYINNDTDSEDDYW